MRSRLHRLTCTILESKVRCVRGEDSEGLRRSGCQKLQVAPVAGCQARGFGGRPKCAPNPDSANSGPGRASLRPEAPRASLRVRAAVGRNLVRPGAARRPLRPLDSGPRGRGSHVAPKADSDSEAGRGPLRAPGPGGFPARALQVGSPQPAASGSLSKARPGSESSLASITVFSPKPGSEFQFPKLGGR
jgi:hypothetical protein